MISAPKQPLTLPLFDTDSFVYQPINELDSSMVGLINKLGSDLLSKIVNLWVNKKFKKKIDLPAELYQERDAAQKEYINNCRKLGVQHIKKFSEMKKGEHGEILKPFMKNIYNVSEKIRNWYKKNKEMLESEDGSKNKAYIVTPYSKKSLKSFMRDKNELMWRDKNKIDIQRKMVDDVAAILFCEEVMQYLDSSNETDLDVLNKVLEHGADTESMILLKNVMMEKHKIALEEFMKKRVFVVCEFISRLMYTLCYMSNKKTNSNDFLVSNLSVKNCFLAVKGGLKMTKNKQSRIFRIVYKAPNFMAKHNVFPSHKPHIIEHYGECFYDSGWSVLDEKVVTEKISCVWQAASIFCNHAVRLKDIVPSTEKTPYKNLMFMFLIMLNNRRSTESALGNLRYLLVNTLGSHSAIKVLLPDFAFVTRDAVQRYIICNLIKNYYNYYVQVQNAVKVKFENTSVINPFNNGKIYGVDDFTSLLYCNFIMTKAPYNQPLEQAHNLESMMAIHQEYEQKCEGAKDIDSVLLHTSLCDDADMWSNDFYFDKEYCFKLGEYAADHLRANQMLPEIHSKWNSILSKSYLDVTTESGMRGEQIDKGKSGFFGKKGHEVVMTELLEDLINKKLVTQFMDIFNSNDTTQKKALNINNLDINYINKIQDLEEPQLKFHVVDKTQWKGSREIYVMSLYTKILQQPLEQFFGFLCKKTSNEMISIPSNKRISHIHSLIFENVHAKNINYEKIFLTLDCRKWGPKSNFTKYAYFILGMSNALPKDLIDYFLCMVLLYYKKQIYVSSRAWNVFKNNKKNKNFLDYFTIVEKLDTAYFTMPYSFVMGIFNYLSSLLHAYNQQFACSEINAHMRKKYDIDLFVNMVAHSDDSAGCIYFPTNRSLKDTKSKIIKEVLYLYEYHLKMANHCLSVKKCLVSPVYFEFISILYIKNELVPLTSKFYGLSLKPTIQGYSADMSQGYSKCIEMLTMGSTLSEAYFSMRLYSEMLRRMYHIKDYPDRPLSAFGGLYAHPILVLLVGAMADCVRLYRTDNKKFNQYQAICKTISGSSLDIFQQVGFVYTTFNVERLAIKNIRDNIEKLYGAALQNEILKNCEVKNSVVYPICFYNKLNSADFIASLNYTDNTRRINQLYYAASSDSIKSVLGLLSIKEVIQLIETCYVDLNDTGKCKYKFSDYVMEEITNTDVEKMDKIYQVNLGDANIVYEYLTSGVDEKVRIEWDKRTCKPIQIQMNLNDKQVDIKYDPSVIFYSDHPDFYLLGVNVDLTYEKQMLIKIMHDMGIDANNFSDFVYHARKLSKAYRVDINGYGYVHGENRFIRDFSGLVKYIESNSIPNHKITRIYNNFVHKYGQAQTFKRLPIIVEKFFKIYKFLLFLEKNISTGDLCKISLVNPNTGDKHSITNFRKVLDSMPSMLNITINTENMLKKEDCADAEFYYTWMKPQKRIGNKWVGSGILVFKVGKIFLRLHLHNNNVSSADFLGDWDRLVDSDLEMVKIVLDYSDITYMSRSPYPTQDYKLGIKNDMLVVDHEERLKAVICTVTEAEKNFAFSLKGSCQPSNKIGQYLTRSGQKIETLLSTFHYNLAEIKGYFFCGDKSIASNLIKSFMVEQPGDIEFDALDIADNFYNSKIYESMVYGKLRRSDYNVRDIIKNYCQDRNITYFDLSMAELHVILELNLDPNLLPLSIQELIKTKIVEENIVNCSEEFWTEYKKCCLKEIKGEEADWGNFLSDWALTKDQVLQLIKTKKGMLEEILINPIMFLEAYPDMCLETAKTITKALDACLNSGYNIHAHDEHHQIFRSLPDLTPSMLYELTFLISMNARFNSIDVNLPSLYITEIFRIIFNNSYLFHIFNKNVENDPLLHFTMIKSDDYRRWSKMYCVFCKVRKELYTERYRNLGDVFKEEQAYGTGLSTETGVYTPGVNKYRPGLGVTNNFTETFQIVNIYPKSVNVIEFQPKKFEKVHYTIPVQQFSNHYDWRKLIEVAGNIDFADDDWEGEDLEMELKDLLYEVKMEYEGTAESAEENSSYSEQIIEMLEIPSFKHNPAKNVQLNYNSKMDSIKMHRMKYPNYRRDTINYKKWNVPLYYLDGEWDMEDLMIQSPEFAIITPSIPCNINLFTGFNDMKFYINPKAKSKGNSFLVTYNLHPLADLDNSSLIKIPNSKILELLLNVENYYKNIFIKENKTVIKANLDHEEYRRLKNHLVDAVRTVEQVRKIKEESGLKNMSEIINNLQKDLPDDWWMDYYEDVKKFDIKFVDLLPEKEEPELISFMDIFDSHNAIQNAKSEEEKVFLTELEKVATFKSKIRRNVFKLANVRCEMIFWKWDENIPLSDDDKNFIDFLQRVSYNLDLKRLYEMTADTLPGIRAFILKNRLPRMSMKDLLSGMDLRFIIGASNVDMQEKILKAKVDKTTSESLYGRKFRHEDYNTFSPIDKGEIFYKEMEALFKENTDYFINNGMILTRSAKNMVQLAVQGLKESIAGAFGTATQEYKKYVSFTQWLGKLIVNSAEYVGSTTNYIAERFYKRMEDLIFNFRIKLKSLEQVEEDIFDDVPPEAEHFILNSILDE
nr:MAG: RNA-dependent RNA polymerase [Guiyang bunya-like virus 1]